MSSCCLTSDRRASRDWISAWTRGSGVPVVFSVTVPSVTGLVVPPTVCVALPLKFSVLVLGQGAQFVQWAAGRTYKNYEASLELGRVLPPGTLVHGKLANGLALENRIRPIFVGRGFGNYEMGYASAMAWVFLIAVGLITVVLFTTGRFWVHYSDEEDR